jgi:phage repressor protein C with HTH and peptisase S24 domain
MPLQTLTRRQGEFALLQLAMPGEPPHNIGVLLWNPAAGKLYLRLRDHWEDIAGLDDREYLSHLNGDFEARVEEMGGDKFLRSLEDSLSNILRMTDREEVAVDSFQQTLERLFDRHVEKSKVVPFSTHLPLYSLAIAAGKFGRERDATAEPEEWVRAPERLMLTEHMFVAPVTGESMLPLIPDGSLCIFRANVVGSRQGKHLLVEQFGADPSVRYTVKKYTSQKIATGEDQWRHKKIQLLPLNPDYLVLELEEGLQFQIIAEFVRVLE